MTPEARRSHFLGTHIARAGKPVVRLVPVQAAVRRFGRWRGKVVMSEDFDAPLSADDLAAWEGR